MNLFTGEEADEYFGGEVPPAVRELLRRAATASGEARGALLWTAQAIGPDCLAVYYALYKHHAGRREFDRAEQAAVRGLAEAARQAGLDLQGRARAPGDTIDFERNGPARFWLFTLKALAFLALRSGRPDRARDLLGQIASVGQEVRIGDDVIAALLAASASPDEPSAG